MLQTKEKKEEIYVDLESYRGFYNEVDLKSSYRFSTSKGVLPTVYRFIEDNSGDSCDNCALRDYRDECHSCFECYNVSAVNANELQEEKKMPEEKIPEKYAQTWENELREIEQQINSLEELIKDKTQELKELKESLKDLYGRLKDTVSLGSKGFIEAHPLFKELDEE